MLANTYNTCYIGNELMSMVNYSHIIPIILSLGIGFFILLKSKYKFFSKIFILFISIFCLWLIGDLITWNSNNYSLIYTTWAFLPFIEIIFYIIGLYFVLISIKKNDISIYSKIVLFALTITPFILTITGYSVSGFNQSICEVNNNNFLDIYKLIIEIILLLIILFNIVKPLFIKGKLKLQKNNLFFLGSMFIFLLVFGITEYISASSGFYELNLYSLFLFPIFLLVIIYAIFELDIFNFELLGTQYLVVGLVILITGQLFFVNGNTDRLLTIITVITSVSLSIILFKNLQRESNQRVYIESLSTKLEDYNQKLKFANEKLKGLDKLKTEFVSLASHQLRSPLTAIKGYASMLLDEDYGEINNKVKDVIVRIFESSQNLAKIVEDLLNVSKIEQGGMKYEMNPFNITEVVSSMCKDLSITAENKGLKLNYISDGVSNIMVNGDKEKIRQIILNFIDNSIKYTKRGQIDVKIEKLKNKVIFSVKDTGMGMTEEIKETLFHKFARGDGSRMNTSGSGLGLYLTKEIAQAHKGRVYVESEGEGRGSTFFLELDILTK